MTKLSREQMLAIDANLIEGSLLNAVREYRASTGCDLLTAKNAVESRLANLKQSSPQIFEQAPPTVTINGEILRQIQTLPNRDLKPIRTTTKQIERHLSGGNYAVTLSANAVMIPTKSLPIAEVMRKLFAGSDPARAPTPLVTVAEFQADILECLTHQGDALVEGPRLDERGWTKLRDELIPWFWRELDALAPVSQAIIFHYSSETGLPGYSVWWSFAYLIHDPSTNRCVVITGSASD